MKRKKSNSKVYDIIIVGGSHVGLSMALSVATDFKILVIESSNYNNLDSQIIQRLYSIAKGSEMMLKKWGVNIEKIGQPINFIRALEYGSHAKVDFDPNDLGLDNFGKMIEEKKLLQAIYDAVATHSNIDILTDTEVEDILESDKGNIVKAAQQEFLCDLLIGADGKNSMVAKFAGIEKTSRPYNQTAIVVEISHQKDHHGVAIENFLPDGPFAVLPRAGGHKSSIVWTVNAKLLNTIENLEKSSLEEIIGARMENFLGKIEITNEIKGYPLATILARRYHGDKLVVIGDAAHAIHPIAGQGLNLGLRDVDCFAAMLIKQKNLGLNINSQQMLQEYSRKRKVDITMMVESTHLLNILFSNSFLPISSLRKLGLNIVDGVPILKHIFASYASGL